MRIESSVTSVSWIPSEAMSGPLRVPVDLVQIVGRRDGEWRCMVSSNHR